MIMVNIRRLYNNIQNNAEHVEKMCPSVEGSVTEQSSYQLKSAMTMCLLYISQLKTVWWHKITNNTVDFTKSTDLTTCVRQLKTTRTPKITLYS